MIRLHVKTSHPHSSCLSLDRVLISQPEPCSFGRKGPIWAGLAHGFVPMSQVIELWLFAVTVLTRWVPVSSRMGCNARCAGPLRTSARPDPRKEDVFRFFLCGSGGSGCNGFRFLCCRGNHVRHQEMDVKLLQVGILVQEMKLGSHGFRHN